MKWMILVGVLVASCKSYGPPPPPASEYYACVGSWNVCSRHDTRTCCQSQSPGKEGSL